MKFTQFAVTFTNSLDQENMMFSPEYQTQVKKSPRFLYHSKHEAKIAIQNFLDEIDFHIEDAKEATIEAKPFFQPEYRKKYHDLILIKQNGLNIQELEFSTNF